jgi:hypothetical protein
LEKPDHLISKRALIYACFIQGDGNFHLQQKLTAPNMFQNPSAVLDKGFWPDEDKFKAYIESRGAWDLEHEHGVRGLKAF